VLDQVLAATFARQHGLITGPQAKGGGATRHAIQTRLDTGRWVRVGGGVYRLAGVPVTWEQRALAAVLVAGPEAVVSHQAAAVLLGISGFRPGRVHITVPPAGSARNPLATVHRSPLGRQERSVRNHIPVTAPARTLADVGRTATRDLLEEAVDDVLCRRLVSLDRLADAAPARLRTVLQAWTPGALPGSPAEMALVRRLLDAGLAHPVRQYWIAAAHARVDLAYPAQRIAIELDSFRWHGGRRGFDSDRSRGNRIVAAGWQLLRATPGGDPAGIVGAVSRLCAA